MNNEGNETRASSTPATPDAREILRARARALARPRERAAVAEASLELLEFRLAQESYALETRHVREVYPLRDLTPLPCTPPFVLGIVNVRGRITPVIDIKKFFDLPDKGLTDLHRIILVPRQRSRTRPAGGRDRGRADHSRGQPAALAADPHRHPQPTT